MTLPDLGSPKEEMERLKNLPPEQLEALLNGMGLSQVSKEKVKKGLSEARNQEKR